MTINDLETLTGIVSKEATFSLTEKVDLIKLVNNLEDYYNKPLSKISKANVIEFIKDAVLTEGMLEDILMEVFPEINFE